MPLQCLSLRGSPKALSLRRLPLRRPCPCGACPCGGLLRACPCDPGGRDKVRRGKRRALEVLSERRSDPA